MTAYTPMMISFRAREEIASSSIEGQSVFTSGLLIFLYDDRGGLVEIMRARRAGLSNGEVPAQVKNNLNSRLSLNGILREICP